LWGYVGRENSSRRRGSTEHTEVRGRFGRWISDFKFEDFKKGKWNGGDFGMEDFPRVQVPRGFDTGGYWGFEGLGWSGAFLVVAPPCNGGAFVREGTGFGFEI
jgi:hypothetical protein